METGGTKINTQHPCFPRKGLKKNYIVFITNRIPGSPLSRNVVGPGAGFDQTDRGAHFRGGPSSEKHGGTGPGGTDLWAERNFCPPPHTSCTPLAHSTHTRYPPNVVGWSQGFAARSWMRHYTLHVTFPSSPLGPNFFVNACKALRQQHARGDHTERAKSGHDAARVVSQSETVCAMGQASPWEVLRRASRPCASSSSSPSSEEASVRVLRERLLRRSMEKCTKCTQLSVRYFKMSQTHGLSSKNGKIRSTVSQSCSSASLRASGNAGLAPSWPCLSVGLIAGWIRGT